MSNSGNRGEVAPWFQETQDLRMQQDFNLHRRTDGKEERRGGYEFFPIGHG